MPPPSPIVCKPTRWFTMRAAAVLAMFSVFAVLFYVDGSTGYREKNKVYYIHQSFETAAKEFSALDKDQPLSPEDWKNHASQQVVAFPDDPYLLPKDLQQPMPWPEILTEYERIKSLQWKKLWLEYSAEMGFDAKPKEEPFSRGKIREQWIAFGVCTSLVAVVLFFFIRTLRRSISADDTGIHTACGKSIAYSDLTQLDLRRWDNKGIAHAHYSIPNGGGKVRIDGLTYGGFNKEHDEPAEQLMQKILANFSGELVTYSEEPEPAAPEPPSRDA